MPRRPWSFATVALAFTLGAVVDAGAPATAADAPVPKTQPTATPADVRATRLLSGKVRTPGGDLVGRISDLVVDVNNERAVYAVVSFEASLGLGARLFAYPVATLRAGAGDDVVLTVPRERFRNAPGFDAARPPDWNDAGARRDVDLYFADYTGAPRADPAGGAIAPRPRRNREPGGAERPAGGGEVGTLRTDRLREDEAKADARQDATTGSVSQALTPPRMLYASEILKYDIRDVKGNDIGDVSDFVVDLRDGRIHYAVVAFDPQWRSGTLVPLPMRAFSRPDEGRHWMVELTQADLAAAPAIDAARWPPMNDARFQEALERFFKSVPVRSQTNVRSNQG